MSAPITPSPALRAGEGGGEGGRAGDLLRESVLPLTEARALLALALGIPRERLIAHPETPVDAAARLRFDDFAVRRRRGEPMAYLAGQQEFHGLVLAVSPAVLIPRPETELLVDLALEALQERPGARVLELGTGSGCIALALATRRPDLRIVATDRSLAALACARENALRCMAQVQWLAADWFAPLRGRFDLILGNPPYVAAADPHLADLAFEPVSALVSGADGLEDLRRIVAGAREHLAPGGVLLLEHGYDQGEAVRGLLRAAGLSAVETVRDLAGVDRVGRGLNR